MCMNNLAYVEYVCMNNLVYVEYVVHEQSRICGIRAWTISHMWNTERIYQFNQILTQTRITSFINLHMRIISICHYDFYDAKELPHKELSHERS